MIRTAIACRLSLPEPAGPPRPNESHPLAAFYRRHLAVRSSDGEMGDKLPAVACAGRY
jgi:hypothetical protein